MNKNNIQGSGLKDVLNQVFKDDLPSDAEARMQRHFRGFERMPGRAEKRVASHRCQWARNVFRKEILAFASAVMLIAGGVMQLSGNQSVLAHSIGRMKLVITVSAQLRRAGSMDCRVLTRGNGDAQSFFRVRWISGVASRLDKGDEGRGTRTLWIPDETVSTALYAGMASRPAVPSATTLDRVWQPALEFLTPALLARHMEKRYGLMQAERRGGEGHDEFLLIGQEGQQIVEITVDDEHYLPLTLKKYRPGSSQANGIRPYVEEVRFQWNQPVSRELLIPNSRTANKPAQE